MSEKQKLNVFQKLVEVRKTIGYIKKEAQGYGYKYAKESDILLAIAEEMNNQGLVLEQVPIDFETVPVAFKGKDVQGLRITFQYMITNAENPSDNIIRTQYMQQPGTDAQTIGAMMTYGMKYFLFKTFNVAMDEYDIDAMNKDDAQHAPTQFISKEQVEMLVKLAQQADCVSKFSEWIYKELKAETIDKIQLKDYDKAKNTLVIKLDQKLKAENAN